MPNHQRTSDLHTLPKFGGHTTCGKIELHFPLVVSINIHEVASLVNYAINYSEQ